MNLTPDQAKAIGRRIRAFREGHDLTQAALASKCFVTQSAVSRWESGAKLPARRTQRLLSEVLRTNRIVLFREVVELEDHEVAA